MPYHNHFELRRLARKGNDPRYHTLLGTSSSTACHCRKTEVSQSCILGCELSSVCVYNTLVGCTYSRVTPRLRNWVYNCPEPKSAKMLPIRTSYCSKRFHLRCTGSIRRCCQEYEYGAHLSCPGLPPMLVEMGS